MMDYISTSNNLFYIQQDTEIWIIYWAFLSNWFYTR